MILFVRLLLLALLVAMLISFAVITWGENYGALAVGALFGLGVWRLAVLRTFLS
jgi:hypothetical protein